MEPELGALLEQDAPERHEATCGKQTVPIKIPHALLDPGRASPSPDGLDDPIGDLPVGVAIELQILAAARCGDLGQRPAIERRVDRRRWLERRYRVPVWWGVPDDF